MSYQEALEATGAKILCYEDFGSYQGTWWAKVNYKNNIFWVQGWYGSCSGCDAFEAEFSFDEGNCDDHRYESNDSCKKCKKAAISYKKRLKEFGEKYLDDPFTQEMAEKEAGENVEWDMDAQEMLDFVKANKI